MPTNTADFAEFGPQEIEQLRALFPLRQIEYTQSSGGLNKLSIASDLSQAEIYLQGAHLARFKPRGQAEVLWMSDQARFAHGQAIRGGVPICLPWFGPHHSNPAAPAHGTARTQVWNLISASEKAGRVSLDFRQIVDDLDVTYRLDLGSQLSMSLTVRVPSSAVAPRIVEQALHTYLTVSDIRQIEIRGLEAAEYIDKVDGQQRKPASGVPIGFDGECDRVYFDAQPRCTLQDPGLGRRIFVDKQGSQNTVVWNPWIAKSARMSDFGDKEWQSMVCIETANVGDAAIHLEPGQSHTMRATISVADWDGELN